ncbi:MAG: FG-GAP-like repeat-containing protein, partial [Polyangiales bacterium]
GTCGFACNGGTHACGSVCARDDLPETCGTRCEPCPVPANARATCEGGACGWECLGGFVRAGDRCRALPRPLWPPSGSTVANRRPAMRWSIPDDADPMAADTVVEFCADRGCAAPTMTLPAGMGRGAPAMDLPRGVVWWRVRAGGLSSASWPMVVGGPENAASPRPTAAFGAVPDFNGDGFGDTVFGAPFASPPIVLQYPGARGGVGLLPPEAINAPDPSLRFGAALAAGDFNGDGRVDLAVGAPTSTGSASRGAVYVFFAGPAGIGTGPDVTLDDPVGGVSAFAEVVIAAGDLDADGYGDLAVGSSRARNQGAVYVYRGTATGPSSTPSWTLSGPAMNLALFGGALAAGDLDADGDSDLVVGASGVSDFTGRAYVYSGSPTGLPAVATLTLQRAEGGQFGAAVAVPGDLDGDGYADLAVGAPAVDDGTGIVLAYRGGAMGVSVTTDVLRRGEAPRGDFGGALVSAGDMNNDGRYDLLVGAGRLNDFTGRAYLIRGDGTDTLGLGATAIAGPMVTAAYFGGVLGAGRDIDGDGFDDVLISAERNRSFAGGAFIYYGSVAGVGRSTEIPSAIMGGRFGYALAARACVRPFWM